MSSRCPLLRGVCSFSDVLIGGCPNHGPCTRVAQAEKDDPEAISWATDRLRRAVVKDGTVWASLGDPGASGGPVRGKEEAAP